MTLYGSVFVRKLTLMLAAALAAAFAVSGVVVAPAVAHPGDLSGVLMSTDGGRHWSYLSTGLVVDSVFALLIDPAQAQTLYAGSERGLWRSRDGGVQWDRQTQGLEGDAVYALAAALDATGGIYAATEVGLFWSANGDAWQQLGKGVVSGPLFAILVDSRKPATLYAAGERGVMRSSDRGGHWSAASSGLPPVLVLSLAGDSQQAGVIYAATAQGPYISMNEGREWKALAGGLPDEGVFYVTASQHSGARLFTSVRDHVYSRSATDQDWQDMGAPLVCDSFAGRTWVLRLVESPGDPSLLWAGSERGLFVSSDGGATWLCPAPFDVTWVQVGAIALDPLQPATVYIGTSGPPYRNYFVARGAQAGALPPPVAASSVTNWLPAIVVLLVFVVSSVLVLRFLVRQSRRPVKR